MTDQDLAKRLAEHPRWEWMRGMYVVGDGVVENAYEGCAQVSIKGTMWEPDGMTPNINDPATQGCMLAMLHETGKLLAIHTRDEPEKHTVRVVIDCRVSSFAGPRGEALAKALLHAWGEEADDRKFEELFQGVVW